MKRFLKIAVVMLMILLVFPVFAMTDDDGDDDRIDQRRPRKHMSRRKLESWYHMFTLGIVANSEIDGISFEPDVSVSLDFLRFYFPMSKNLIFGVGINGTGHKNVDSETQLNLYLYSASLQYYFKSIGDGFFLRADVGASKGAIANDDGTLEAASEWGFGFLVGVGYAFPISRETSILFYGTYRSLDIEGIKYNDISFQAGWLW